MFESTAVTLAILALSVALQSLVGFGLGMVAIPLLLMRGYSLPQSVFLGLAVSLFSSLVAARGMGSRLPWRLSAVASAYRIVGVIPGLALARLTCELPGSTLKGILGLVIGAGVLGQLAKTFSSKEEVPEGTPPSAKLAPLAFLTSGVLTGWVGMGGPPLVFWQLTGRPEPAQSRGFLFGVYFMTIPFQLALMAAAAPAEVSSLVPLLLASAPLTWAVSSLALHCGDRLSGKALSWVSLAFLSLLAFRSVADWILS